MSHIDSEQPALLRDLSDDILLDIAERLATECPPALFCLSSTSKGFRALLEFVDTCRFHKVNWDPAASLLGRQGVLQLGNGDGLTLSCKDIDLPSIAWVAAMALPTSGIYQWCISILHAPNVRWGEHFIGVCNEASNLAWGLHPDPGSVWNMSRHGQKCEVSLLRSEFHEPVRHRIRRTPRAPQWPATRPPWQPAQNQCAKDRLEELDDDWSKVADSSLLEVVDVVLNADEGKLSYRAEGGPLVEVITALPREAPLRPMVGLFLGAREDYVRISRFVTLVPPP